VDEQGLIIANTVDSNWLLRPVVRLSDAFLKSAEQDKRWGNNPTPEPLGEDDLAPAVGATQQTIFNWETRGTTYHAVAVPLTRTHWTFVTSLPTASFEAATQDLLRTSMLAIILGLILAFAATIVTTRPMAAGLRRVTAAAKKLAQGDVEEQLNFSSRDEIGQMAAAFGDVTNYLRQLAEVADRM